MAPLSISEIAHQVNPEIDWKPPWRARSASPSHLARRAGSAGSSLPRRRTGNPAPARPGRARAPPPTAPDRSSSRRYPNVEPREGSKTPSSGERDVYTRFPFTA